MKKIIIYMVLAVSSFVICAKGATELSYQGRLLDTEGNPVMGGVNVEVSLYDAESGGLLVYSEDIGSVSVADGVYSFVWGVNGVSTVSTTEQLGVGDGSTTVFNATVGNTPVENPSVTISDSTYSWNDQTGSSSPANFLGTVSDYNLGTVSAIYLSSPPASSVVINVEYSYQTNGVKAVIVDQSDLYIEISIDGENLSPRQKLTSVPTAVHADYAYYATHANTVEIDKDTQVSLKGYVPRSENTIYYADTDGFVMVQRLTKPTGGAGSYTFYIDDSNPPVFHLDTITNFEDFHSGMVIPVAKGKYWRLSCSNAKPYHFYWVPLSTE